MSVVTVSKSSLERLEEQRAELAAEQRQALARAGSLERSRPGLASAVEGASSVAAMEAAEKALEQADREARVTANRLAELARQIPDLDRRIVAERGAVGARAVAQAMLEADRHLDAILEHLDAITALRVAAVDAGAPEHIGPPGTGERDLDRCHLAAFRLAFALAVEIRGSWRTESVPAARVTLEDAGR